MTLGTHVAFASVLYLGGATLFGYTPGLIGGLLIVVTSILPDIDHPPAKIGRLFWFVSVPLERRFGHRTLTHSLVALGAGPGDLPVGLDSTALLGLRGGRLLVAFVAGHGEHPGRGSVLALPGAAGHPR